MAIIQTPTPNLPQSLAFYQTLGFDVLPHPSKTIVSDGKAIIEINPTRFARAGFQLYQNDWTTTVEQLKAETAIVTLENGYLLGDTSGNTIYLIETDTIPVFPIAEKSTAVLGNFAGLSLEVIDIQKALKIYAILGFKATMGSLEQGWIALTNATGFTVSLMKPNACPHLFFNPSMTYFNGVNNLNIIQKIRDLNIPITEEITEFNQEGIVDNIIIRDPGGYGFFLFSD